ncbi:nitrate ABC transporter substrate-binding protein [Nocardia jiangxiensis]|uniref:Nitrate ABC transporter substrate-binding protein n=1 Tax=Nocardia jiangxiensis TaxID=282685 RepID=A0ABW6SAK2_9NOCA|nr:nitrate ABC transporter substrate-binding protein [Nocardia jiangxiensis]
MKKLFGKRFVVAVVALLALTMVGACADNGSGRVRLRISYQDTAFPALIQASGVLSGTKYDVEWSNLTGPAANLQALYGGAIDLGHMGDTSLTIEQANSKTTWTKQNAPLAIVAGWRNNYDPRYAPLVTAVRTSAGIDTPAQLRGHSWAYNFGGYNHAQYLASLVKAGTSPGDIQPKQFTDGATAAAAFNDGRTDVYSGSQAAILSSLQSGQAKILLTEQDTGIPALGVWTASRKALADKTKDGALQDFFGRLSGFWSWYDAHPDAAKAIIEKQLKVGEARAEFEYHVRSGSFWNFDANLIAQEQQVAVTLHAGGVIPKLPDDVGIGFDPRYNQAQKAIGSLAAEAQK